MPQDPRRPPTAIFPVPVVPITVALHLTDSDLEEVEFWGNYVGTKALTLEGILTLLGWITGETIPAWLLGTVGTVGIGGWDVSVEAGKARRQGSTYKESEPEQSQQAPSVDRSGADAPVGVPNGQEVRAGGGGPQRSEGEGGEGPSEGSGSSPSEGSGSSGGGATVSGGGEGSEINGEPAEFPIDESSPEPGPETTGTEAAPESETDSDDGYPIPPEADDGSSWTGPTPFDDIGLIDQPMPQSQYAGLGDPIDYTASVSTSGFTLPTPSIHGRGWGAIDPLPAWASDDGISGGSTDPATDSIFGGIGLVGEPTAHSPYSGLADPIEPGAPGAIVSPGFLLIPRGASIKPSGWSASSASPSPIPNLGIMHGNRGFP